MYHFTQPSSSSQAASSSESPSDTHEGWDKVIHYFLARIGFTQAADGFAADLLVMNSTWERNIVPDALLELTRGILTCTKGPNGPTQDHAMLLNAQRSNLELEIAGNSTTLEQRKLDYVHLANDAPPRSQSTINKEISLFLARNRARNDASNRSEFVYTPAEKRQRLSDPETEVGSSCARVDAKPLDRDVQMKYDIAKNEEGPLSRTMHGTDSQNEIERSEKQKGKMKETDGSSTLSVAEPEGEWTAAKRPGLDDRMRNVEAHLAVRFVPSAPRTLLSRLTFLEEHLIRLEKDYPPWAALHFNQPNRGWPPPPHQTPIIVPPHLRPKDVPATPPVQESEPQVDKMDKRVRNTGSSLHRAVMERLEVQQAMADLG
ncbi:hypothetical protein DXG01_013861 [Tephrocybe rancida]|nr:hypothetical protein DXG01_013861 [Tephrocybe rancida]